MEKIKLIDWLNEKENLIKVFGEDEVLKALDKLEITEKELTKEEDLENEPYHNPHRLIKPSHHGTIRVSGQFMHGGQMISAEGYKDCQIETYLIPDSYQTGVNEKIIKCILLKRFKWFNKFKWSIYGSNLRYPEIYLNTKKKHKSFDSELSLYVPLKDLWNFDKAAIVNRNKEYWGDYTKSDYELNKKKEESFKQFNDRKEKECKEYLEVLETKTVKDFLKLLD